MNACQPEARLWTGKHYPLPILVVNMSVLEGSLNFLLTVIGELLVAIEHINVAFQYVVEALQLLRRHAAPL